MVIAAMVLLGMFAMTAFGFMVDVVPFFHSHSLARARIIQSMVEYLRSLG